MAMTAPTPRAVTQQLDFFRLNADGDSLFSVKGGVPLREAFDQLTGLLDAAKTAVEASADEPDVSSCWAAFHILAFSAALTDSMHRGLIAHEQAVHHG